MFRNTLIISLLVMVTNVSPWSDILGTGQMDILDDILGTGQKSHSSSSITTWTLGVGCSVLDIQGAPQSAPFEITFSNHRFSPQKLTAPAGQPLQIKVVNSSSEKIEFESFSLNRERVVQPGQTITVRLPALRPGSYDFFDDFHEDVPEGAIVASGLSPGGEHPKSNIRLR